MYRAIIIGFGEIGHAILDVLAASKQCMVQTYDEKDGKISPLNYFTPDAIHVCFPEHHDPNGYEEYISRVVYYAEKTKCELVVIHTTISLRTAMWLPSMFRDYKTNKMETSVVHIPIRGTHGQLDSDISKFQLYAGWLVNVHHDDFNQTRYIETMFPDIKWFKSGRETALAKLAATIWYGANIAFVQNVKNICDQLKINFDEAYTEYNRTDMIWKDYTKKPRERISKPVFYPGKIGGKCVIQDAKLLLDDAQNLIFYADWLNWIINTNDDFTEEKK